MDKCIFSFLLHYITFHYIMIYYFIVSMHTIVISIFPSVNYIKKGKERNHAIKVLLTLCVKEFSNAICVYFIHNNYFFQALITFQKYSSNIYYTLLHYFMMFRFTRPIYRNIFLGKI